MDAIRNGARGLDDLTNYVIGITNYWTLYNTNVPLSTPWTVVRSDYDGYDPMGSLVTSINPPPAFPLTNGYRILGLLGMPRLEYVGGENYQSNYLVAFMRALSGSATEKFPQSDRNIQTLAFSYRMIPEVGTVPLPTPNPGAPVTFTNTPYAKNLLANMHDVRLLFRWPLLANFSAGNGRQSYRSLVSGQLVRTNDVTGQRLHFFEPTTFVNAP
jgi:hypothetical protein